MFRGDDRVNAAADEEIPLYFHPAGSDGFDEVVQDFIRDRLVKSALITVRPQIKFERF